MNSYLKEIILTFYYYKNNSLKDAKKIENDFKSIDSKFLNLLSFDIKERINKINKGIEINSKFLNLIIEPYISDEIKHSEYSKNKNNINKLISTLKLFIRDWSIDGKKERELVYSPIINEFKNYFMNNNLNKKDIKILIPGTGLGRLQYEISKLGFNTVGIEVSYFMLLCTNFLFNKNNKINKNLYLIQPLIHNFNNIYKEDDPFKNILIPDEDLSNELINNCGEVNIIPGDFLSSFNELNYWDCIVTSFFIDTANNIIEFIEKIYKILKKNGVWINCGPLLYHFTGIENEISIELSWEEIEKIIIKIGFNILKINEIKTTYSSIENLMKQTIYSCMFFIAKKE